MMCLTCGKELKAIVANIGHSFCSFDCAQDGYLILQRDANAREAKLLRQLQQAREYAGDLRKENSELRKA